MQPFAVVNAKIDNALDPVRLTGTRRGTIFQNVAASLSVVSLLVAIYLASGPMLDLEVVAGARTTAGVAVYLVGICAFLVWNRVVESARDDERRGTFDAVLGWTMIGLIGAGFLTISAPLAIVIA